MMVAACVVGTSAGAQHAMVGGADVVLVGGKVWTGVASDPVTQAVAIDGTHILATGTSAAMLKLAVPGAKIIQLHGRLVLPGFNDAHVHIQMGGANLVGVHLTDSKSQAEFRERIAAYAKTIPKGKWILNGLWDEQRWSPVALPTHQLIDDVTPDNPVAVSRTDLHMILANAYAMKLAGVDRNTKDVPGGVIMRDAEGNPTGIFKDAAKDLILVEGSGGYRGGYGDVHSRDAEGGGGEWRDQRAGYGAELDGPGGAAEVAGAAAAGARGAVEAARGGVPGAGVWEADGGVGDRGAVRQ